MAISRIIRARQISRKKWLKHRSYWKIDAIKMLLIMRFHLILSWFMCLSTRAKLEVHMRLSKACCFINNSVLTSLWIKLVKQTIDCKLQDLNWFFFWYFMKCDTIHWNFWPFLACFFRKFFVKFLLQDPPNPFQKVSGRYLNFWDHEVSPTLLVSPDVIPHRPFEIDRFY